MPKGAKGETRPTDVIGAAVKITKIATGELPGDTPSPPKNPADTLEKRKR